MLVEVAVRNVVTTYVRYRDALPLRIIGNLHVAILAPAYAGLRRIRP